MTDDFTRDRLVIGLNDKDDKVRLLREKKLDLKKAIQICTFSEVTSQQMKKIQGVADRQTEEVKKFSKKKKITASRRRPKKESGKQAKLEDKSTKTSADSRSDFKCKHSCRHDGHVRRTECPAFGKTCSKCQKKGHFSSVCYSSKKVHQVEDIDVSSSDESCLRVETISLVDTKARQWFAEIEFFQISSRKLHSNCGMSTGHWSHV